MYTRLAVLLHILAQDPGAVLGTAVVVPGQGHAKSQNPDLGHEAANEE